MNEKRGSRYAKLYQAEALEKTRVPHLRSCACVSESPVL